MPAPETSGDSGSQKRAPLLLRVLHLRRGEWSHIQWVAATGLAYAAATALSDDIAQALFVSRIGAHALPSLFLLKALVDTVAAALYARWAVQAPPVRVWRQALVLYLVTILISRALITHGDAWAVYALYVGHECAWTVLTIHWGVLVLRVLDASQARRLFPLLFTLTRVGGLAAGLLLYLFAKPWGATNLLFGSSALILLSLLASYRAPRHTEPEALPPSSHHASTERWGGWKAALTSPLVRAIAYSTVAMVIVRFGLQLVSLDVINALFHQDEHEVAAFLGGFAAWANSAGILLGVLVMPSLLARFGIGAANIAYALATVLAFLGLLWWPGLATAAAARMVQVQFKDAVKTPISALFYGAEKPQHQPRARSLIFGAVIPLATAVASVLFELCHWTTDARSAVTIVGGTSALGFTALCVLQNHRWRAALVTLLRWRVSAEAPEGSLELKATLTALGTSDDVADVLARGLRSADGHTRAVAQELLCETIPRRRAQELQHHHPPGLAPRSRR